MPERRTVIILGFLAAVSVSAYLLASMFQRGPGFPLDDAWIHQTYARNLATLGEWSFVPGQPSAGSTAPLWSLLLSIGTCTWIRPIRMDLFSRVPASLGFRPFGVLGDD